MNCYNHPKNYAVGICKSCGRGICIECAFEFDKDYYCTSCVQKRQNKDSQEKKKKSRLILDWTWWRDLIRL